MQAEEAEAEEAEAERLEAGAGRWVLRLLRELSLGERESAAEPLWRSALSRRSAWPIPPVLGERSSHGGWPRYVTAQVTSSGKLPSNLT